MCIDIYILTYVCINANIILHTNTHAYVCIHQNIHVNSIRMLRYRDMHSHYLHLYSFSPSLSMYLSLTLWSLRMRALTHKNAHIGT